MSQEVINDLFGYEGLKVIQRPDMLNFSLDTVLISHFVTVNQKTKSVLDIGTGNGAIPLILTTRTKATITGVELQADVSEIAQRSVTLNQCEAQITIVNNDILNFSAQLGNEQKFDVVVSNPPFFEYREDGNLNESDYKTIARHEKYLPLETLIQSAAKCVKSRGYVAFVHRADRLSEITHFMEMYKIVPKRIQFVYPKPGKNANTVLIEGIKDGNKGGNIILPPLIAHKEDGTYSDDIYKLFMHKG